MLPWFNIEFLCILAIALIGVGSPVGGGLGMLFGAAASLAIAIVLIKHINDDIDDDDEDF